jgi:hypothetical protein
MQLPGLFQNPPAVGYEFPLAQSVEFDYDPSRGYVTNIDFDSVSQEAMLALQQKYVNSGIACRLKYAEGRAKLTINDSTQEYTLDSWEIGGKDEELSPLLSPIIYAELLSTGNPVACIDAIRAGLDQDTDTASLFAAAPFATFDVPNTEALYPLMKQGLTGYENSTDGEGYVLQHRTNVSNRYQVNVADFGTGSIYSTAQLLSEVTDSGLWIFPLPGRLQFKIANLVQPPAREGWIVGWFKGRSEEHTAANNRVDIVTEYIFGQFATCLYSFYNG